MYISFYIYLIAGMLICDHWFHALLLRQSSCTESFLFMTIGMKPVVADKHLCD